MKAKVKAKSKPAKAKAKKPAAKAKKANKLFPGQPNYTGPSKGMFGLLHHQIPLEYSHDAAERVRYVKAYKSLSELPTRLRHMVHIDPELLPLRIKEMLPELAKTGEALAKVPIYDGSIWNKRAAHKINTRKLADLCTKHKKAVTKLLNSLIPNCAWDGEEITDLYD